MRQVIVNKADLIKVMKANREAHHGIVVEAQAGFRAKVIARLDEMLALARNGKKIDISVGLQMPSDYTAEYDTVIGMLEMDVNKTVELDYEQYKMWVQDEWGWTRQFTTSNAFYSATAASKM
jgi:hypothetical protein